MILKPELVRGAGDEMIKAGVVGCGGRGTQAAIDFITGNNHVQVVAVGDLFEDQLETSLALIADLKQLMFAKRGMYQEAERTSRFEHRAMAGMLRQKWPLAFAARPHANAGPTGIGKETNFHACILSHRSFIAAPQCLDLPKSPSPWPWTPYGSGTKRYSSHPFSPHVPPPGRAILE